jgi:carboxylate-amine ligase
MDGTYRFGIEEEYFLADATTRGTPRRGVAGFHKAARARLKVAEREIMESQVEVSTPPLTSFAEARATLAGLRARYSRPVPIRSPAGRGRAIPRRNAMRS